MHQKEDRHNLDAIFIVAIVAIVATAFIIFSTSSNKISESRDIAGLASFSFGDRVQTTQQVNVRESYGSYKKILGTQPAGAIGTYKGSVQSGKVLWYNVDYNTGVDGWSESIYFQTPATKCSDNTKVNTCSKTKPKYCNSLGNLVDDCNRCGCSAGQECQSGSCVAVSTSTCSDGTAINQCSSTKPLYCNSALQLINNCGSCGCSAGYTCQSDGACIITPITQTSGIQTINSILPNTDGDFSILGGDNVVVSPSVNGIKIDATTQTSSASSVYLNVKDFGAKGDGRYVIDGVIYRGSNVLSSASGKFKPEDVGKPIMVWSTKDLGASLDWFVTTIARYQSPTEVVLTDSYLGDLDAINKDVSWGTDDADAIQAAIDAALPDDYPLSEYGITPTGGTVFLPPGAYILGKPLTIRSKIVLRGSGLGSTILRLHGTANKVIQAPSTGYAIGQFTIEDISINANQVANSYGIYFYRNANMFNINRVQIKNAKVAGIYLVDVIWPRLFQSSVQDNTIGLAGYGTIAGSIISSDFHQNNDAILLTGSDKIGGTIGISSNWLITDTTIESNANAGLIAQGLYDSLISQNHFEGNGYDIYARRDPVVSSEWGLKRATVSQNVFEWPHPPRVHFKGMYIRQTIFQNNQFSGGITFDGDMSQFANSLWIDGMGDKTPTNLHPSVFVIKTTGEDLGGQIRNLAGISSTSVGANNLRGAETFLQNEISKDVQFKAPEADSNYFVSATVSSITGNPSADAMIVYITDKTKNGFKINLKDKPNAGTVTVDWILVR